MLSFDYELFVIGGGSGGVRAARMAASLGLRVALAEKGALGGTCVNVGCVPKKLYVYGSHYSEEMQIARSFGWNLQGRRFFWEKLQTNKNREIKRLNGVYAGLLESSGVELLRGAACLKDEHTVELAGKRYSAAKILVASGSRPYLPDLPGQQYINVSTDIFAQRKLPKRIAVVGGGYIAVEFAAILQGLGCETTLIYRGPLFLRNFDDSIRRFFAEQLDKKGLRILFGREVVRIEKKRDNSLSLFIKSAIKRGEQKNSAGSADGNDAVSSADKTDGGKIESGRTTSGDGKMDVDQVLYATGRVPFTSGLGLENAGVELSARGAIEVNHAFQTNIPSIYALGDVIGRVQLTPVALAEAASFVANTFCGREERMHYDLIPTAIFSQPPIGTVGLTEAAARQRYKNILLYQSIFRPLKYSLGGSDEKSLMKLVVDSDSDRLLGVHIVGPDAGEIIQGLAIALKAGATKKTLDSTIGVHPTSAEEFVSMREPY